MDSQQVQWIQVEIQFHGVNMSKHGNIDITNFLCQACFGRKKLPATTASVVYPKSFKFPVQNDK